MIGEFRAGQLASRWGPKQKALLFQVTGRLVALEGDKLGSFLASSDNQNRLVIWSR